MKDIFCGKKTNTNEEYRKVIKAKMVFEVFLTLVGMATVIVMACLINFKMCHLSEYISGVYTGVGSGLFVAGIVLFIRNARLLRDEDKLRKSRIANSDERIISINQSSVRVATLILLFSMYAVALIGGAFNEVIVKIMLALICLFLFSYIIAYKVFESRR